MDGWMERGFIFSKNLLERKRERERETHVGVGSPS